MKCLLKLNVFIFFIVNVHAQTILNVPEIIQEQDQWCWAGTTKSILDYYGFPKEQCEIAEYTRQVSTWHDFGDVACCTDPNSGCNYWNYNWGTAGSMEDILEHFGSIESYGFSDALSLSQINTEITEDRPFIIRWGWDSGGGHFMVGHGFNDHDVYYMNPWFNEGYHVGDYDWMVDGSNHTWTHTNILTTNHIGYNEYEIDETEFNISPNPVDNKLEIRTIKKPIFFKIYNIKGQLILKTVNYTDDNANIIDVSMLKDGVYYLEITYQDTLGFIKFIKR